MEAGVCQGVGMDGSLLAWSVKGQAKSEQAQDEMGLAPNASGVSSGRQRNANVSISNALFLTYLYHHSLTPMRTHVLT
jgi:hypothetical protein